MSPGKRLLFLTELAVCFLPASIMLALGVIFLPNQLLFLSQGFGSGSAVWVATTLGGVAGITGLFYVARKILEDSAPVPNPALLWLLIGAGVVTLAYWLSTFASGDASKIWLLMFGLPMIASVHIIYLGRKILF